MQLAYSYIRFSTPEQRKGNSLARQLKLSRDYAEKHGLLLDETLSFRDLGVSAFNRENIEKGALGVFLQCVQSGKIGSGSFLLVESLDRLSRADVSEQLAVFIGIINAGITIVTLTDGRAYSRDTVKNDWTQLIVSLAVMSRAHEESATKSQRLNASWEAKRAKGGILTGRCPAWITLNKETHAFDLLESRCALIRRIFTLAEGGMGKDSIARTFNREEITAWGRGNGWYGSYIQKILQNRSVIGEFQHHRIIAGKRETVGEPISNYFPAIITTAQFHTVQNQRRKNALFMGKAGKGIGNLFTGIARCGYSDSPMVYVNKGKWRYLVSDSARRGNGTRYVSWSYREFETAFLTFVSELDFSTILTGNEDNAYHATEAEFLEKKGQLEIVETRQQRLVDAIAGGADAPAVIVTQIAAMESEKLSLANEVLALERRMIVENAAATAFRNGKEDLNKLILHRDEREMRYRLRSEIRNKIERIDVFSEGDEAERDEAIGESVRDRGAANKQTRYFRVTFKNRAVRLVKPDIQFPSELESDEVLNQVENEEEYRLIPCPDMPGWGLVVI